MIDKELRALLPLWVACAAALLGTTLGVSPLDYFAVPVYFVAVAALGAFSIGHEYTYGTLGTMLALPVPRARIWAAKLGVLVPLVAALAVIGAWRVTLDRNDQTFGPALFWAPALAAVFVAPWITMASRSPMAGAVFTMGLVGGSMALGEWIGIARHGYAADVDAFRRAFMAWSVGALSLAGAVGGWRAFARLEVAGDADAERQLPVARAGSADTGVRRVHPFAALVWKELRLQQLSFVVAAICLAGLLALTVSGYQRQEVFAVVSVLSGLYMLVLPALIGSLAGAQERQLGVHDAQLLLPIGASRQWVVKVATAIVLVLVLPWLLPVAVKALWPPETLDMWGPRGLFHTQTVIQILTCASVGLYVSTLGRSGLNAMIVSIAAFLGIGWAVLGAGLSLAIKAYELAHALRAVHGPHRLFSHDVLWLVPGFLLPVLVLRLAFTNYRYADRPLRRVALHAAITAAAIAVSAAAIGALEAVIQ
jgi:ABC-type transport system involved in multi-copper enzyme maturation permease subunit